MLEDFIPGLFWFANFSETHGSLNMFQEHSEPLGAPSIHMSYVDSPFTRIFHKSYICEFLKFDNTFKFWLNSNSSNGHLKCGLGRVSAWNSLNFIGAEKKCFELKPWRKMERILRAMIFFGNVMAFEVIK